MYLLFLNLVYTSFLSRFTRSDRTQAFRIMRGRVGSQWTRIDSINSNFLGNNREIESPQSRGINEVCRIDCGPASGTGRRPVILAASGILFSIATEIVIPLSVPLPGSFSGPSLACFK
ncbi:hypothetical protein PUN28_012608 [Cardiocondyla obscurior]|uniref:Uncharacterized protein n=1 Tax=Cardiocondyla obscurior TaxID=286306 RepID=A0AAW2FDH8_9HYME